MKYNYRLGGYYLHPSEDRIQLPLIYEPSVSQLKNHLNFLNIYDGVLTLRNDQEENHKPYELTLYSDDHNYLVMLATILPDGDIDVRTFRNPLAPRGFIPMLGEPFGVWSIVQDFELVIKAFTEYLETGDVSRELLD